MTSFLTCHFLRRNVIFLLAGLFNSPLRALGSSSDCVCPDGIEKPSLAQTCNNSPPFMVFLEATILSQCSLRDPMLCYKPDLKTETVDFIIVGAGSGGCVVASRLSEVLSWKVTLLEAGGPAPAGTKLPSMFFNYMGSSIDWSFPIEKHANSCLSRTGGYCRYPRGKVMGGTSIFHGNMYMRGNKEDYAALAKTGLEGWGYEDVLPYFKKSEDNKNFFTKEYHSEGGLLTVSRYPETPSIANIFIEAARELGYETMGDPTGKNQSGFTVAQMSCRNGERLTAANAFLYKPEILARENLNIITYAYVVKILFDDEKRAIGVTYYKDGIYRNLYAKKEVILCAGAIGSPQLLLLSGVGPKKHLCDKGIPLVADVKGVGQNFQNHVSVDVPILLKEIKNCNRLNVTTLTEFICQRTGPLTSTGMSQLTGFVHVDEENSEDAPDIQFMYEGLLANCSSTGFTALEPYSESTFVKMNPTLLTPQSRGYIELASSDPFIYPKIVPNYFSHEKDIKLLIKGVRVVQKFLNTDVMRRKKAELYFEFMNNIAKPCTTLKEDSDEYWACIIKHLTNPENHQMSTCKMGTENDGLAVVDSKLRVRNVSNLRVCDASILPQVVRGNTFAVVTMVAEKACDMVKEDWLEEC